MKLTDFPACCTATVARGFGESIYAEDGNDEVSNEQIDVFLKNAEEVQRDLGMAVIVATTNNQQTTANDVLRKRGYKHSKWMKKKQHPHTKIRLWFKPLWG